MRVEEAITSIRLERNEEEDFMRENGYLIRMSALVTGYFFL